jgi:hypothetical protein
MLLEVALQARHMAQRVMARHDLLEEHTQAARVERFRAVVIRTGLHGGDCAVDASLTCHHDKGEGAQLALQRVEKRRAIALGHHEVGKDNLWWGSLNKREGLLSVTGTDYVESPPAQECHEPCAGRVIVLGHQYTKRTLVRDPGLSLGI